jgi:hypothetical protein
MADEDILHRIKSLVDEEHELRSSGDKVDGDRITGIEETLDQCWDLLRQRRAHREFGEPETEVSVRDVGTVERYLQ